MLAKKKAAKRAAMSAVMKGDKSSSSPANSRVSKPPQKQHGGPKRQLSAADAVEAGSGPSSRETLLRRIGDHINTRLQDIGFDDDLDADLFDEKRAQLMEEARLAAGVRQRAVSQPIAQFLSATAADQLASVRIAHSSNSVTCVAALGLERVVIGDKSGKVFLIDTSPSVAGGGVALTEKAEERRRRKRLLEPSLPGAIYSLAISDTRGTRPTSKDLFEKTTVDTSCTSYIAAGAADGSIAVWETFTGVHKGLLFMHRKPVTSLAFRMDTSTLYSTSMDGTLRVWSVPQMMTTDKLFGHEGAIHGLDALRRETAVTVGEDATMRFWKIDAATQQAYKYVPQGAADNAPGIVLESVAMLNETVVVAGARNGDVVLFDVNRRRPLLAHRCAHGCGFIGDGTGLEKAAALLAQEEEKEEEEDASARPLRNPNPITAVAAVPYGDVIASASYDGVVRVWRVLGVSAGATAAGHRTTTAADTAAAQQAKEEAKLVLLAALPVPALVSSLRFSVDGDALYMATAKEPRGGRWVVLSSALNGARIVPLTDVGRRQLRGMQGQVEHIPAQLYGLEDHATTEQDEEEEPAQSSTGLDAADVESEEMDEEEEGEAEPPKEEDSLFTIGKDGAMQFKKGIVPSLTTAAEKSSKTPKVLRKGKKDVPAAANGDAVRKKKAKKSEAVAAKKGGSGKGAAKKGGKKKKM